jgi:hypothetical protein
MDEPQEEQPPEIVTPYFQCPRGVAWKAPTSRYVLSNWIMLLPRRRTETFYFGLLMFVIDNPSFEVKRIVPGSTHEMQLTMIAPTDRLNIYSRQIYIEPSIFAAQWYCKNDEIATKEMTKLMKELCCGEIDIGSDHQDAMILRYGSPLISTSSIINQQLDLFLDKEEIH